MSPKPPARSSFKATVQATPSISGAYRAGIQALLPADKRRLTAAELATGSVALDEALKDRFPSTPRWDYGIGLPQGSAEQVLWLEVHHSASGETERVLRKLQALKAWLRSEAPELNRMPAKFIWLLSNVERNPNDQRRRRKAAEQHGLRHCQGMLNLATLDS